MRYGAINRLLGVGRRYSTSLRGGKNSRGVMFKSFTFLSGMTGGALLYDKIESVEGSVNSLLPLCDMKEPIYATPSQERQAISEIRDVVGDENISGNKDTAEMHATTSLQARAPREGEYPDFVVYPSSTEEVSKIMKICHHYRMPITAYAGGTSLEGQITPIRRGISLDMSNMNRLIEVHDKDFDVVVQPGIGWQDLNEQLEPHGVFFGPDPGPGAEIGGMIGTACSGTNSYRYGTMRQNVINVTVVLTDGSVIKTRRRPRKSSAGYSLTDLFVGAEGTLGIVTEATLKVNPIPAAVRVGLLTFDTADEATDTVEKILQNGIMLDAIEFLDDHTMKNINDTGVTDRKWDEKFSLLLRFAGSSRDSVDKLIDDVRTVAAENKCRSVEFARDEDESNDLWLARKNAASSLLNSAPMGYRFWTTDVAVPISHLTEMIVESKKHVASLGLREGTIGHVGDGNFHCMMVYDPNTQIEAVEEVVDKMIHRALALGGTCTGEHGVGLGKREHVIEEVGSPAVDAMRKLKQAYDPYFILNPGKIFSVSQKYDAVDH